jgi:hypothetical protein
VVATLVLALIETPTIVWLSHGVTGIEQLDQFGHGAAWLVANSLAPADAVRLVGYLLHYDIASTYGWTFEWEVASWVVVAIVIVGLAALRGAMRPVAIIAAISILAFVSGTNTPLAPALTWLFEHVPLAQVFRELYHAMAVVSLVYALAAAASFALASRSRYARIAQAVVLVGVAAYVAPILSGDVSGWLQTAPTDRYLAPAFRDENAGPGRVVWFPLDQPLAFDGRGAGVDPMAVTERGSLWLYALTWPLTEVDMTARVGDETLLRRELRAVGVAAAVNRSRFQSRYAMFSAAGAFAKRLFDRPLAFGPRLGVPHEYRPGLVSYDLSPVIAGFWSDRFAIVPRRLGVIADLSLAGIATFGFAQQLPAGMRYDVYYDEGDLPWEALQASGLTRPFPAPGVDARNAFAGGDVWWWWRRPYADSRRFALALGRAGTTVEAEAALHDARLVVAWIGTPAGGELEADCGDVRRVLDTGGTWDAWRSAVVDCGPLSAGERVSLRALDNGAEVALRGAQLVEGIRFEEAQFRLAALLRGAGRTVPLGAGGRLATARTGKSGAIGFVRRGRNAVLEIDRARGGDPRAAVSLEAPDRYVVAWRRFAAGSPRLQVPLVGDGSSLQIRPRGARVVSWRLKLIASPASAPRAEHHRPAGGPSRLYVLGETFDRGWQFDGAIGHLPSALGTNVFLFDRPPAAAGPRLVYSAQYHAAFGIGTLALLASLWIGATLLARVRLAQGSPTKTRERMSP